MERFNLGGATTEDIEAAMAMARRCGFTIEDLENAYSANITRRERRSSPMSKGFGVEKAGRSRRWRRQKLAYIWTLRVLVLVALATAALGLQFVALSAIIVGAAVFMAALSRGQL